MRWVIASNADRTEFVTTEQHSWESQDGHSIDTEGQPMSVIHTFEAADFNEARRIKNTFLGNEWKNSMTIQDLQILNTLRDAIAKNENDKGFRDQLKNLMTETQWQGALGDLVRASVYTANQHGESSEFWEAFRKGTLHKDCDKSVKMVAMGLEPLTCAEEEIADEFIRILGKAEIHGVDVAKAVFIKMAYNSGRPLLHGGKKA